MLLYDLKGILTNKSLTFFYNLILSLEFNFFLSKHIKKNVTGYNNFKKKIFVLKEKL